MDPDDLENQIAELNTLLEPSQLTCSLSSQNTTNHANLISKVTQAIRSHTEEHGIHYLSFEYNGENAHLILDFIVKEQDCCPFFDFEIQFRKNPNLLTFAISSTELSKEELRKIVGNIITA